MAKAKKLNFNLKKILCEICKSQFKLKAKTIFIRRTCKEIYDKKLIKLGIFGFSLVIFILSIIGLILIYKYGYCLINNLLILMLISLKDYL